MNTNFWLWISSAVIIAAAWPLAAFLSRWIVGFVETWTGRTATRMDDLVVSILKRHLTFWIFLGSVYIAFSLAPALPPKLAAILEHILLAGWILSFSLALASLATQGFQVFIRQLGIDFPATSLTENILRVIIVSIGILMLLANMGISITPALTALGVGSLAVALALQDTLSNLFAGFHILISRQIKMGDYVKLESGSEGNVLDIGWRSTRIQELANNVIIVPNAKLAQTIVTNYDQPDKKLAVLADVFVSYRSDLAFVERVTLEVARETMRQAPGGVTELEPLLRYQTFDEQGVRFVVILYAKEFRDRFLLVHEFIKRLHARYKKEGIEIPLPQRVVYLEKSSS